MAPQIWTILHTLVAVWSILHTLGSYCILHTDVLQCECCSLWYCSKCCDISEDILDIIGEVDSIHWFCQPCEKEIFKLINTASPTSSSPAPQTSPLSSTEFANSFVQGIVDPLKDMMEKLVKPVVESLDLLKNSLVQSTQMDVSVEDNQAAPPTHITSSKNTTAEVIEEYMDREQRKLNVVVHNVPEESTSQDLEKVTSMFESEFSVPGSHIVKVARLGNSTNGRPRLLLATLDSEQHKRSIIKNAIKLSKSTTWNKVYVSPDLTAKEREVNKALREELKRRRANGERDIIIKRGKIVSKCNRDPQLHSST